MVGKIIYIIRTKKIKCASTSSNTTTDNGQIILYSYIGWVIKESIIIKINSIENKQFRFAIIDKNIEIEFKEFTSRYNIVTENKWNFKGKWFEY
jgi:hypothetical protein